LEGDRVVGVQSQHCAANAGGEWRAGRKVHRLKTHDDRLIPEVAGCEVDVDPLGGSHFEDPIHAVELSRVTQTLET
jgi:hypothetical protein